jgi:glutathione S-transferase
MGLCLYGYRYSVYTRIVRMALAVRELEYETAEVNPFDDPPDPVLAPVSPFRQVPVLDHDGFVLCETSAILRYLCAQFPGPALVPDRARAAARMEQVIAVVDAHGYYPMVRQVFSHAVFRPLIGMPADPDQIAQGLRSSAPVLRVLDGIAAEGLVLNPDRLTLADLHLAPMVGYFTAATQGAAAFREYPALGRWWQVISQHPTYRATDPALATLARDG